MLGRKKKAETTLVVPDRVDVRTFMDEATGEFYVCMEFGDASQSVCVALTWKNYRRLIDGMPDALPRRDARPDEATHFSNAGRAPRARPGRERFRHDKERVSFGDGRGDVRERGAPGGGAMETAPPGGRRPAEDESLDSYFRHLDADDVHNATMRATVSTAYGYTQSSMGMLCTILDAVVKYNKDYEPLRMHAHVCRDLLLRAPAEPPHGNGEEGAGR